MKKTNAQMVMDHAQTGKIIKIAYEQLARGGFAVGLITPDRTFWNFDSGAASSDALLREYETALPGYFLLEIGIDEYNQLKQEK